MRKPWPNGSGLIVPRSFVWTLVLAMLTVGGSTVVFVHRSSARLEAQMQMVLTEVKGNTTKAQANEVAIGRLQGRLSLESVP